MANLERVQLLVDALRSGKYQQCQGVLARRTNITEHFCASGVACKVAEENGAPVRMSPFWQTPKFYDEVSGTFSYTATPVSVLDWYDFDELIIGAIIHMNDSGKTFNEIAWWLKDVYMLDENVT